MLLTAASADPVYRVLAPERPGEVTVPAGKRVPAGWPAFPVGEAPVLLRPALASRNPSEESRLRLTVAVDDRSPRLVSVRLAGSGTELGVLDLRYAHAIQTFELRLGAAEAARADREGVSLRLLRPGAPLWFFGVAARDAGPSPLPVEFQPHLLDFPEGADRVEQFRRRMASLASLQTFGWMEGCVLEGLNDLARLPGGDRFRRASDAHWRIFLPDGRRLVYENPRSEPADGRVYGIEGGLPFADLARRAPADANVDLFLAFARGLRRADGAIQDDAVLSAEGSYTIAYPLAVIAAERGDPELGRLALEQLRLRAQRLWHDGAIWLRRSDADHRTFRGWARGVTWHALGVARSIEPLRRAGVPVVDLEAELRRIAAWVLPLQRADGLWSCFIEDGGEGVFDTSGSAGIAAALAIGADAGALGSEARAAARRTLAGLEGYLTPDGLLGGAAQSNRGGEALQRSDYRVISQMGMGLMAQLMAAVSRP